MKSLNTLLATLLAAVVFGGCTTTTPAPESSKPTLPVANIGSNPLEDFNEFFQKTIEQAELGNPDAQLNAGAIYLSGSRVLFGVDKLDANLDQALVWYKKLSNNPNPANASQGAKNAGFILVKKYRSSHDERELEEGLGLLRSASTNDHGALMLLAMYQVEFDRDSAEGRRSLALLAQQGNPVAREYFRQQSIESGR